MRNVPTLASLLGSLIGSLFLLAACGTKGPLTLPPPRPTATPPAVPAATSTLPTPAPD